MCGLTEVDQVSEVEPCRHQVGTDRFTEGDQAGIATRDLPRDEPTIGNRASTGPTGPSSLAGSWTISRTLGTSRHEGPRSGR